MAADRCHQHPLGAFAHAVVLPEQLLVAAQLTQQFSRQQQALFIQEIVGLQHHLVLLPHLQDG